MSYLMALALLGNVPQEDLVEFILCRHGETHYNVKDGRIIQGSLDDELACLNEVGKKQAVEVAEKIAKSGLVFKRVVSSSLNRALETAQSIASRMNLPLETDV